MQNKTKGAVILVMMVAFAAAIAAHHESSVVHPAKISKLDASGEIFARDRKQ